MRTTGQRTTRVLLVVTAIAATAALAIGLGVLDLLSGGGTPRARASEALLSLLVCWALACIGIVAVVALRARPAQTVLAVVAIAVALGAAEIALRLTYPPSWPNFRKVPSPEYHHINQPGVTTYWKDLLGTRVFVTTNEDGLRTDYSRPAFLERGHRIAVLGDSFTFGHSVRAEKAFPQVLEGMLRQQHPEADIGVLNAGVISYSPLLGNRLYRGVVRHYRPHLVLYMVDATDIGDDYNYMKELAGSGENARFDLPGARMPTYYGAVGQLIGLEDILYYAAAPLQMVWSVATGAPFPARYSWYAFRLRIGEVVETNRYFIYRHPLKLTSPYFETTFAHVRNLAEAVEETGARFVLVIVPRFQHWNPSECPDNWEADSYALPEPFQDEYFRFFASKESEVSFEIYSLLPAFQATEESPLVFRRDPHWNEAGNAFVARTLADHMTRTHTFN